MRHKLLLLIVCLITVAVCAGCWDSSEIDRRAIVVSLGMDAVPQNKVKVSAQFILIESSPLGMGEKPEKPFVTISSVARTAFNASPGLESKTTKSLFYGQLKSVVVNRSLAERGLKQYLDFLERVPNIPPQGHIVLTEGTSQDILSVPLGAKVVPGVGIDDFFDSPEKADQVIPLKFWEFVKKSLTGPTDPFLPIIAFNKEDQAYRFMGLGVFHRDRLVGKLAENGSRMAGLLMGKAKNAYLLVRVPQMGEVSVQGVTAKTKIKVLKTKPMLNMLVSVKASGHIRDIPSEASGLKNEDINRINQAVAADLKNQMIRTIRQLQFLNSDIIGFGETLRATRSDESWETIKWDEEYPRVNIRVSVKFNVEEVGVYR